MPYMCTKCGHIVKIEETERLLGVRCPKCNCRILIKVRPPIIKKVDAV
ncbi:MAG: DNA-directed RNA polymerase subunit P [Candidatus Baldrarchaeia archaeon]